MSIEHLITKYESEFWATHDAEGYDAAEEQLRGMLIGFLYYVDRHGCYSDDDRLGENFKPLSTIDSALNIVNLLQES